MFEMPQVLFLGICLDFYYFSTGVMLPKLGFPHLPHPVDAVIFSMNVANMLYKGGVAKTTGT
ncbi:hypothetical protein FRC0069_01813 [Corynebacterium diphtheriae]|nr:hypothetical protein FRC0069_01813 [Corynebacterium diphtheriae]